MRRVLRRRTRVLLLRCRHVSRGIGKQWFAMVVLSPAVAYYTRIVVDKTLGRFFPALSARLTRRAALPACLLPARCAALLTHALRCRRRVTDKGFQKWVPDFIFAPALATTLLTTLTPILFDRYDRGREARARSRAARLVGGAEADKKRA